MLGRSRASGTAPCAARRPGSRAGAILIDQQVEAADLVAAQEVVGDWLMEHLGGPPLAVGHRVVHGGPDFAAPVLIDDEVLARLEQLVPLAPLHQPNNLAPIRSIRTRRPELPQVACFDTAFHRSHPEVADRFAIPEALYQEGVRRYGFHGLSYEHIAGRLPEVAPEIAKGRVIVAHLGSGVSACAIVDGRSIDSTMGFTALDGLPMGTRPGQLDPGVVLYLAAQKGMEPEGDRAPALSRLRPQGPLWHQQRRPRPAGQRRSAGTAGTRLLHLPHRLRVRRSRRCHGRAGRNRADRRCRRAWRSCPRRHLPPLRLAGGRARSRAQ